MEGWRVGGVCGIGLQVLRFEFLVMRDFVGVHVCGEEE